MDAGIVWLIGTAEDVVVAEVERLLTNDAAHAATAEAVNPYGDGRAAAPCAAAIRQLLGWMSGCRRSARDSRRRLTATSLPISSA
ncbi:hypothetical protein ACFP6A_13840 [Quadrisphaera sp. GCM10027208]|uniref:hypothetical protein n=1 Tax=Quadrisphaera sp. GCM10027208 TaxID=3273423 RepID=UPI00360BA930